MTSMTSSDTFSFLRLPSTGCSTVAVFFFLIWSFSFGFEDADVDGRAPALRLTGQSEDGAGRSSSLLSPSSSARARYQSRTVLRRVEARRTENDGRSIGRRGLGRRTLGALLLSASSGVADDRTTSLRLLLR